MTIPTHRQSSVYSLPKAAREAEAAGVRDEGT